MAKRRVAERKVTKHIVEIGFDRRRGTIICTPHKLVAKPKDSIEWACDKRQPFTIDFGWDSPFEEIAYPARAGERKELTVPEHAADGFYEYFIALYDKNRGLVYTLDPDLIIRRDK